MNMEPQALHTRLKAVFYDEKNRIHFTGIDHYKTCLTIKEY